MGDKEQNLSKGQKAYLKRVVNEFRKDAESEIKELQELKSQIIEGEEGNPSLIERLHKAEKDALRYQSQINSLHKEIFVPKVEGQQALAESILNFTKEFKRNRNEIDAIKQEINNYYDKLFGAENEEGERTEGIQDKINAEVTKLKQLYTNNKQKQESLFDDIEKLLKGASTVALAKAFKEHKDSFNVSNYIWMGLFILSTVSMMGVSIYIFANADFDIKDMWKGTIGNLPFIGGAIWMAIYSSKQRSQNKRLQQEYAFKEDVAKIYYGLKKEIEELDDTDLGQRLNKRILEIIVDVVSANPSDTLDNSTHNDKGPILEALNNLSSLIKGKDIR